MTIGETDLSVLLRSMSPVLQDGEYVYCTLPHGTPISNAKPVCIFQEQEGITIVIRREFADKSGLSYESVFRWITLSVHSSLDAVGFLAKITQHLAAQGISTNCISAYYHDHLFVPVAHAGQALRILRTLRGA
jgi:hypothetical protein